MAAGNVGRLVALYPAMGSLRVALMPGSIRRDSVHRRLAHVLYDVLAGRGVTPELIDLADFPMPLYDGDAEAEQGQPQAAVDIRDRLATFDGLILVTPEYNGGPSALMKNAIDWVTRVDRTVFRSLLIGLAAASPGSRGAIAGLASMRAICEHMRLDVLAGHISIPHVGDALGEVDGRIVLLRDDDRERVASYIDAYVASLIERRVEPTSGRLAV